MLLKKVDLVVGQEFDLSFYLEFAKLSHLNVGQLIFLIDLGYPAVHLELINRKNVPGFILYRMASVACDDVCLVLAKSTKVKAVLHLLSNHENEAVLLEVKRNKYVSPVTLGKMG